MSATQSANDEKSSSSSPHAVEQAHASASGWVDGYAPDTERPLAGYATLVAGYAGGAAAFALSLRAANKHLPDRIPATDLLLMGVATHKISWIAAKDRVTSFLRAPLTRYQGPDGTSDVVETPRGHGLRLAAGELAICPFCLGQWVASGMLAGYTVDPRAGRYVASLFSVLTLSDFLNVTFSKYRG